MKFTATGYSTFKSTQIASAMSVIVQKGEGVIGVASDRPLHRQYQKSKPIL